MDEIRFEVGGKYENMKGIFEVIAIRRDSMDIRWESGEEISTPIELQQRIIERMQHEKEMEAAKARQKAKKSKASSKAGKQFTGLEATDFSNTVSKTSWRGRGQLGGAVAQRFKTKQFKFNSWAVLRKPEVNWLDVKRQKQEDLPFQGKFFARVEDDHLFYGLTVPAPTSTDTPASDWHRLMAWLTKPENDAWLNKQCQSHDLYLCDPGKQGFRGNIAPKEEQWVNVEAETSETNLESLSAFLSACVKSDGMDLRIQKRIDKATAIEKKQGIAGDMAALFETLMPIYVAVADTSG